MTIHLFVPAGFETRPSGGNVYDRHLRDGLIARGCEVVTHEVRSDEVGPAVAALPIGATALVDSLVASWAPEPFLGAPVRVVPLVHLVFGGAGEHELLARAPVVVATSRWTRRTLLRDLDPRRVHVATPGAPRVVPTAGSDAGSALLCVAALTPAKGHDVLLAALGEVADLDWTCTLVGSPDLDRPFADRLCKRAADSGIADRIRCAGELARSDLYAVYASSDLAVVPSREETYGMVVTEALAHGLPVLASAVGGVPEALGAVGDETPGVLVGPDDPELLARCLRRWLEDPDLRRSLREVALARRRTLPTWEATAAAVAIAVEALP
ncbi:MULTISPECIES: glycosyltransferase family 4 protein [unclassified Aeromicrobium]|uniref:glycosyltransferase family 4 protein n=1 Tax=unclassified Aeromicrobium TaxID=2633570 RepID=UPI00396B17A7